MTAFKFRFVSGGSVTGLLASKGQASEGGLRLGEHLLAYSAVIDSTTRDDRVVLTVDSTDPGLPAELRKKLEQDAFLVLHIYGIKAEALERIIDRHASAHDECGYFDRVQGYGEFYFYFLLVLYGFSHKRRHMCDDCGASLANKLLALNSIFLLGVPNALVCAVRARSGRDVELGPLAKANRLAKKGKMDLANAEYQKVLQVLPDHPGVHLNMTRGYLGSQRAGDGLAHLQRSLDGCANFEPAISIAARISGG